MFSRVNIAATILLAVFSGATLAEIPVYGVIMSTPTTPYWNAVALGLKEGAFEENADYYLQAVENDQTTAAQLAICNNMLDRKPNVILVAAMDAEGLSSCLKKAESLNIPAIALADTPQSIQIYDTGVASVIQSNYEEIAIISARFISESLGSNAKGSVVIINDQDLSDQSLNDNNQSSLQIDTFTEQLHSSTPDLQVITTTAKDLAHVLKDTSTIANTIVRAIVSTDNAATLTTINSLPDSDAPDLLVVSLDYQADNSALLFEGKIHAAISQLPYLVGKRAMERASLAMDTSGNDINDVVYIQPLLLTKETLEEDNNPMLKFIR